MELLTSHVATVQGGLIILDLDGTLADTIHGIRDGVNLALTKYGFPTRSYEEIRRAIGNGARELIRLSVPEAASHDAELVDRVYADYNRLYATTCSHCRIYDGMDGALTELCRRGYTLAVLSNKQDVYVKSMVAELFGSDRIVLAQGQTDLPRKPDPTVPLMIAEQLGFSPARTAFVGDSEVDVLTGKNAGMLSVACSWGYRDRELLKGSAPDALLDAPAELLDLFC